MKRSDRNTPSDRNNQWILIPIGCDATGYVDSPRSERLDEDDARRSLCVDHEVQQRQHALKALKESEVAQDLGENLFRKH